MGIVEFTTKVIAYVALALAGLSVVCAIVIIVAAIILVSAIQHVGRDDA